MHGGYRRVPHFVLSGNRYKQRKRKLSASAKKKKEKALAATSSSTSSLCVLCSDVCFMRPESKAATCITTKQKKQQQKRKKKQQQFRNARGAVATFHHGQQQKVLCNGVVCLVSLASFKRTTHTYTYIRWEELFVCCLRL